MAPNFSNMMSNMGGPQPQVTSVEEFLSSAIPAKDISQVQLNGVPDYSAMMNKLKEKGKI